MSETITTATVDGVQVSTGDAFDVHGELVLYASMRVLFLEYVAKRFPGWGFVWSPMSGAGAWLRQRDGDLDAVGFTQMTRAQGVRIIFPGDVPADAIVTLVALPPMSADASRPYFEALGRGDDLPPPAVAH